MDQLSHLYMTNWKNHRFDYTDLVGKVISLLFNMLSKLVIAFLPRSKCLLISWLQSPSAVILEPKKIKPVTLFIVFPSICHEVMGPDAMIFIFWIWVLSQLFHSSLSSSSRGSFVSLHFRLLEWCHLHIEVVDISPVWWVVLKVWSADF